MSDETNTVVDDVELSDEPIEPEGETPDGALDDDDEPLRPAGQKALQAEKVRRRDAEKALREAKKEAVRERDQFAARIAELEALAAGKTVDDEEIDFDAIREEAAESGRTQALTEVAQERVTNKIEALASGKFHDPADALVQLWTTHDLDDFLGDDGKVNAEAIKEALDELLEKKPYLAAAATAKRFQGSGDGGARKGPKGPSQLTEQDLKRMTPEQIVKAHDEGRFKDLLG